MGLSNTQGIFREEKTRDMRQSKKVSDGAVLPAHIQEGRVIIPASQKMTNRNRAIYRHRVSRAKGDGPLTPGDSLTYGDLLDPFGKSCVQPTQQEQRRKVFVSIHPPVIG
jgi:hypothetical protein